MEVGLTGPQDHQKLLPPPHSEVCALSDLEVDQV